MVVKQNRNCQILLTVQRLKDKILVNFKIVENLTVHIVNFIENHK